ncbi:MAG: hypothetical protein JWN34_1587 [Bryobacterales bacterium]|jgi:hypothetical protein|nr:hypothetical protein [Bryobacterales bacterium]
MIRAHHVFSGDEKFVEELRGNVGVTTDGTTACPSESRQICWRTKPNCAATTVKRRRCSERFECRLESRVSFIAQRGVTRKKGNHPATSFAGLTQP